MKKILIVDDEEKILSLVKKYALHEGFDAHTASGGNEALDKLKRGGFDLVVLDVMMPDMSGYDTAQEIRKFSNVPIIMLTAKGDETDKIRGFLCGVDDYVTKPFSPRELMLRICAVLKRTNAPLQKIYSQGALVIDDTSKKVTLSDVIVPLSPKEYGLLLYMLQNKGVAISRDKFISEVWGYDYDGFDRTLDTHVKLLRKKLGAYGNKIQTVRGVGYRFEKED